MRELAAILYGICTLFVLGFQFGLILGKPWGKYTMGGYRTGSLPMIMRIAPLISILILTSFSVYLLQHVGLLHQMISFPSFYKWIILAFKSLAVFSNSITKSRKERKRRGE